MKNKIKIQQKPIKLPRAIINILASRYSKDPIFGLMNRWIGLSSAFNLGVIISDILPELSRLRIWVGDTGVNTDHILLKPLLEKGVLKGTSYTDEKWFHDPNGHGTHVLSNCASTWDLANVVAGKHPLISILPGDTIKEIKMCKILTDAGTGTFECLRDMLRDIEATALNDRPHIVNLSIGGDPEFIHTDLGKEIDLLFQRLSKDTLFCVAAGNRGWTDPDKDSVGFPGNIDSVLTISNTNPSGIWGSSSIGPEVDLGFYGVNQIGADGNSVDGYTVKTGTSMATPAVVSSIGILLACMWKMGFAERSNIPGKANAIEFVKPYLQSKQLLRSFSGGTNQTGIGILNFPDDGRDMKYLYAKS